ILIFLFSYFFFSSRRRHTRFSRDWSSDVCSSDLWGQAIAGLVPLAAVVAENGGVTFFHSGSTLNKIYGVPASSLPEWRRRMQVRSEERRVGKECRNRRVTNHEKRII